MSVVIFSEDGDISTVHVMDWLKYYFNQENVIRINDNNDVKLFGSIENENYDDCILSTKYKNINIDSLKSVWFRRYYLSLTNGLSNKNSLYNNPFVENQIFNYIIGENLYISTYLNKYLFKKKSIGTFNFMGLNKLECLEIASSVGLIIPPSILTTSKYHLLNFLSRNEIIITKSANTLLNIQTEKDNFVSYTSIVSEEQVIKLPDNFYPSFFQKKINKKIEIRTFFILGLCYSMAIFSQADEQTQIDFRQYNKEKPNRTIPFNLPKEIELKISNFMKKVGHNTGSFDFILSNDNKFYFLEMNPIGQFGMVSFPCNYFIEKKIAQLLINDEKK